MKLLASVLTEVGTFELQSETPHDRCAQAPIALVLPGFQAWLSLPNARALVAFLEFAIRVAEAVPPVRGKANT